jgi:hypothetical protein
LGLRIARMQLLEDELLEISCSNMTLLELQVPRTAVSRKCLLESNYHTQDNAVIVITKATSVLHFIHLKKKLFYTKILTSDFYTDNF